MSKIERRRFIKAIGTALTLAPGIRLRAAKTDGAHPAPTNMPAAKEVHSWNASKDSRGGPTLTGSPSWHMTTRPETPSYTARVVDRVAENVHVDGKKIWVANYGCNSGHTPDNCVMGCSVRWHRIDLRESQRVTLLISET